MALVEHQSRQGEFIAIFHRSASSKSQAIQQKIRSAQCESADSIFYGVFTQFNFAKYEQTIQLESLVNTIVCGAELRPTQSYVTPKVHLTKNGGAYSKIYMQVLKVKSVWNLMTDLNIVTAMGYGQSVSTTSRCVASVQNKIEQQRLILRAFIYQQPLRNNGLVVSTAYWR